MRLCCPHYFVHFVTGRWFLTSLLAMGLHKSLADLSVALCLAASLLFVYALEGKLRGWLAAAYDHLAVMVERIRLESVSHAERRA